MRGLGRLIGKTARRAGQPPYRFASPQPLTSGAERISLAPDGSVWAFTGEVFVHCDGTRWRIALSKSELPFAPAGWGVHDLAVDDELRLWVARGDQVVAFDGSSCEIVPEGREFPGQGRRGRRPVQGLSASPDGSLWGATTRELARRTDDRWEVVATFDVERILAVHADGSVWALTAEGLALFDGHAWRTVPPTGGTPAQSLLVNGMATGPDGAAWAVTRVGLERFDGNRWTVVAQAKDLPSTELRDVAVGRDGAVWVATKGGVLRLRDGAWEVDALVEGFPVRRAHAVAVDRIGGVWVGTSEGLAELRDHRWRWHTSGDGLPLGDVTGITESSAGDLWAATMTGEGLYSWNPSHEHRVWLGHEPWSDEPLPAGLLDIDEYHQWVHVVAGSDGTVWAAAVNALARLRPGDTEWTLFRVPRGVLVSGGLAVDARGRVVLPVRTDREPSRLEVVSFDGNEWEVVARWDELPGGEVTGIAVLANNSLWVGTSGGFAWVDKHGIWFWQSPALNGGVHAVASGADGSLWVATSQGLSRSFVGEPARLRHLLVSPRPMSQDVFTASHGLPDSRITALAVGAEGTVAAITDDGPVIGVPETS